MTNTQAIAYAVLAFRRAKQQDLDEDAFIGLMEAFMDEYTEDEAVRMAYQKGGR
jgi:hypothetical protein